MAEMDGQYYILLKGKMAEKRDKGITGFSKGKKFVSLLEGEILISVLEKDQPKENTLIKLNSIERPSVILECCTTEVQRIDQDEAKLLLPLCSLSERLKVFRERKRLTDGKKMGVGSKVWVMILVNRIKKEFQGIIRYKGPLPGTLGTMFGVELLESVGKGSTDGSFKGKHYFKCAKDGGVFVSLEKLALRTKDLKTSGKDYTEVNGEINNFKGLSKDKNKTKEINSYTKSTIENSLDQYIEHNLYDPVWVYIDDKPQRGIIEFIGRPPGEKNILAGIKMDNKCGKGDGEYYHKQLFKCDKDHAHFTPISNVISKEKFSQMFLEPQKSQTFNSKEDRSSTSGSTCNDIVQMESKFSKVSETEVIKQQEEMFRKAKEVALAQRLKEEPKRGIDQRVKPKRDNYGNLVDESYSSWTFVNGKSEEVEIDWTSSNGTTSNKPGAPLDEVWKTESTNGHGMSDRKRTVTPSANGSSCYNNLSRTEHRAHVTTRSDSMSRKSQRPSQEATKLGLYKQSGVSVEALYPELEVGSLVEVLSKASAPKYGVIRWIGFTPNTDTKVAGLELEEEMDACSDGTFLGRRYFHCPPNRGFFVHLHNCRPDSRFGRGGNSVVSSDRRLSGTEFGLFDSPVVKDQLVPPPEHLDIYIGNSPRGIQGHHNSCYLDATLFATFAFSSVMDSILLRPKEAKDIEQYEEVQTVLRDNIVYPLRANGFVRADRVLELRRQLDRLGTVGGLTEEEKDPEEFLMTLLKEVLKTEPFLKIKSGSEVRNEYFYQVLADKDVECVLPSVEELLKRSFHQSELKLAEFPSCLIVQMPRFGKGFKMYRRILPSLTINISELVDHVPQECVVCGRLAEFHCKDCFTVGRTDNDCSGNFCGECNKRIHSHNRRAKHNFRPLVVSREMRQYCGQSHIEPLEMELFAVVCIETSHYVAFTKCENNEGEWRWCFFDSMADRKGAKSGYNIPSVTECPEIIEWLSSEKQNRDRIIKTDDKDMPDKVRRILGDAYMCLYQSMEVSMYK